MIKLELMGIPPTANHAYATVHGHRVLSSKGKKYKTETKTSLVERFPRELRFFRDNAPYLVAVRFYFEEIENKGWFQGTAASRYKRLDLTNRVKLLEDCLKDAAGIDDSQHLRVILDKQKGTERTVIWVWDLEQEETPFDAGFNGL